MLGRRWQHSINNKRRQMTSLAVVLTSAAASGVADNGEVVAPLLGEKQRREC